MDKKKFNDFINSIELIDEIIPEFHWQRKSAKIEPGETRIELNLKTLNPIVNLSTFDCGNTLEIKGLSKEGDVLFSIKGTVLLRIKFEDDLGDECIELYSKQTASFSTIPAFRILVKDALQKMGLPPITLPLIKAGSAKSAKSTLNKH
ncbi:MAG: hypothetical protein AB7T22_13765 [Calditrichaceae bacterium]